MIALGHMFNGKAGETPRPQQQALNNMVIWGNNPDPNVPTNGQTYETAFNIPSEDQIRVASSGRESVAMHNAHYGNQPEPQHHHEAPPPPPPPKCD